MIFYRRGTFTAIRLGRWQLDWRDLRETPLWFSERFAGQHGIAPLPWNHRINVGPYRVRVGFLRHRDARPTPLRRDQPMMQAMTKATYLRRVTWVTDTIVRCPDDDYVGDDPLRHYEEQHR